VHLIEQFDGSAMALIESSNHKKAPTLVQQLVDHFPGFCDYCYSPGGGKKQRIAFLKRAQICVGDWNAALKLDLPDMDKLTTFADYRVPQLLRHCNVLIYSKRLAAKVDACQELDMNSAEEIAIRACTVAAVEYLVDELNAQDEAAAATASTTITQWTAVMTDWYLWQVGERMQNAGELQPHHRVRTIYY